MMSLSAARIIRMEDSTRTVVRNVAVLLYVPPCFTSEQSQEFPSRDEGEELIAQRVSIHHRCTLKNGPFQTPKCHVLFHFVGDTDTWKECSKNLMSFCVIK